MVHGRPISAPRGAPRHRGRAGFGGATRCVTPRQTCPRPNGFGRNLRSKTRWFTGFCNSHQVSHFATFFIDARAEISVAESRLVYAYKIAPPPARPETGAAGAHALALSFLGAACAGVRYGAENTTSTGAFPQPVVEGHAGTRRFPARRGERARAPRPPDVFIRVRGSFCCAGIDNDPSAGSPTETLLRLLLPLNDKVQWTSRDVAGGEPPTSPRSEHFTGPFNR